MNYEVDFRDDHVFIRCPYETLNASEIESLENILLDVSDENVILHLVSVRNISSASKIRTYNSRFRKKDKSFIVIATMPLHEELDLNKGAAFNENEALEILQMEEIERKI